MGYCASAKRSLRMAYVVRSVRNASPPSQPSPNFVGGRSLGWGQRHANYFVPTTYLAMNLRSIEFFQRQTHHPWKETPPHAATA